MFQQKINKSKGGFGWREREREGHVVFLSSPIFNLGSWDLNYDFKTSILTYNSAIILLLTKLETKSCIEIF